METLKQFFTGNLPISQFISKMIDSIVGFEAEESIKNTYNKVIDFIKQPFEYLPYLILILCGVLMVLLGKRLMCVEKFVGCLIVGFIFGWTFVAPLVSGWFSTTWIVGLVIGLIFAVLCKFVYIIGVAAACFAVGAYATYKIGPSIAVLDNFMAQSTLNKFLAYAAVSVVLMIIVFLLLKYFEMLLTSAFGAFLIIRVVSKYIWTALPTLFDIGATGELPLLGTITYCQLIFIGVITLLGFIFQIATRKRY